MVIEYPHVAATFNRHSLAMWSNKAAIQGSMTPGSVGGRLERRVRLAGEVVQPEVLAEARRPVVHGLLAADAG